MASDARGDGRSDGHEGMIENPIHTVGRWVSVTSIRRRGRTLRDRRCGRGWAGIPLNGLYIASMLRHGRRGDGVALALSDLPDALEGFGMALPPGLSVANGGQQARSTLALRANRLGH
jgi:hypothetical protein